jgi:hypothetical protein
MPPKRLLWTNLGQKKSPLYQAYKGDKICFKLGFFINFLMILAHFAYFFIASSTATATATVAPTIGLLPIPIKPIIST